jgi:hypothetical protein
LGRGEMGCLKIQKDIPLFLRDVVSLWFLRLTPTKGLRYD